MLKIFKTDGVETLNKELLKNYIDEKKIQTLIDSGLNINRRDEKGRTLLFELSAKRRIESVKILIKNGININAEDNFGRTVLSEAVNKADGMMIRFFNQKWSFSKSCKLFGKNSSSRCSFRRKMKKYLIY